MPTMQITVSEETAAEIRRLMSITGHDRPGALVSLLIRLYGSDLKRRMSDHVALPQDIPLPSTQVISQPRQDHVAPKQDMKSTGLSRFLDD